MHGGPIYRYDKEVAQQAMATIKEAVQEVNVRGGKVLFITERQLLTFGNIKNVELHPDYEKVFLMEMAMSKNEDYLDKFKKQVSEHEFDLIVTSPQKLKLKESDTHFGEENNAWVEHISVPLRCYYRQNDWIDEPRIQLMIPNPDAPECPEKVQKILSEG